MRYVVLMVLLVCSCATSEVDWDFVDYGTQYYFGSLHDAVPAIGISFEDDGTLKTFLYPTTEEGTTPITICLRGSIYTAFGEISTGCMSSILPF